MRSVGGLKHEMNLLRYYWFFGFIGIAGCSLLSPSSSTTSYNEDLSSQRLRKEIDIVEEDLIEEKIEDVTPSHDQTAEIDSKLAEITSYNSTSRTAPGFTIQVYSGTSREQASHAKTQVYKILPQSRPQTKYEQPIYTVRVGAFGDRLEAQNVYAELLKKFPDAIVIPSKIRLK
jgi:hypothetical protein